MSGFSPMVGHPRWTGRLVAARVTFKWFIARVCPCMRLKVAHVVRVIRASKAHVLEE